MVGGNVHLLAIPIKGSYVVALLFVNLRGSFNQLRGSIYQFVKACFVCGNVAL